MVDCELEFPGSTAYTMDAIIWGLLAVWWIANTWLLNRRYSQRLQKFMSFFVMFKTLNEVLVATSLASCGNDSVQASLEPGLTFMYTLYSTFVHTCFLFISKGFCITRGTLQQSEVLWIAVMMGML